MAEAAWLLLTADAVAAPLSAATSDGRRLLGWPRAAGRPHPQARRCAPAVLDADGAPAAVSVLWPQDFPLFDDPAVLQARRAALAGPWPRAASALTVDAVHWAGSVWVGDGDPFRLLGRPALLQVGAGVLGRMPRPTGPALERYAGASWPAGSF